MTNITTPKQIRNKLTAESSELSIKLSKIINDQINRAVSIPFEVKISNHPDKYPNITIEAALDRFRAAGWFISYGTTKEHVADQRGEIKYIEMTYTFSDTKSENNGYFDR